MPKPKFEAHANRKVTDFFTKVSKSPTTPRRLDEVARKSSTLDKSVISISSADDALPSSSSTTKPKSSKTDRRPNSGRSTSRPVSKQSQSSEMTLASSGASPKIAPVSRPSKPQSKPKKTSHVVSAEDSEDDGVSLPAIVLSSASTTSDDHPSITPKAPKRVFPLTPRQNLELPSANNQTPTKSSSFPSPKLSNRKSALKSNVEKRPSPFKRARYHSPERKPGLTSESDADDEHEREEQPPSTPRSRYAESINEVVMETDDREFPPLTTPLIPFESVITTPISKKNEIIPSSQRGEMEIDEIELGLISTSDEKDVEPMKPKQSNLNSTSTLSPCSARTLSIINQIKAKAERDAAVEAEKTKTRISVGLTENESDLSSLSDSSDLSLDLSAFGKTSGPAPQPQTKPKDVPTAQDAPRRSARHQDVPAPNYKIKLSLVRRDSSPSSIPIRTSTKTATSQRCPLDKIVKESASLKASAEVNRQASRATSVDYYSMETSSFMSDAGVDTDHHFDDDSLAVEDTLREAVLGKEASEAVGKILQDDRKKRKENISTHNEGFSVWNDHIMVTEDAIPGLYINERTSPYIASLNHALDEQDYEKAALMIDSGTFFGCSQQSESSGLLSYFFKLVFTTSSQELSMSAYRALVSLPSEAFPAGWLTEPLFHWVLQRLGLKGTILEILHIGKSHGRLQNSASKITTISRLLTILSKVARSPALTEAMIPSLTTALLIIGMDPLISSSLRLATISTIEVTLSEQTFSTETELLICKAVHGAIVKLTFTLDEQKRLLELLSGCSSTSGRIRRWIAWSMLGGEFDAMTQYSDFPSSSAVILNLFSKDAPGEVKMIVHGETDYGVLGTRIDILSVMMTDIEGYAKQEGGREFVEAVYRHLDKLLGTIFDTRAAHLDRSVTKDAINRLCNRLQYQLDAAMQLLRPRKDKLHHFFKKKKFKPSL